VSCIPVADELREFRDTIVSMLDTYSYERSILQTATALLNADKYMQIERLAAKHASAFSTRADYCEACHLPLSDGSITLRITLFDCQHAFHDSCLRNNTHACPLCQSQQQQASGGGRSKSRRDNSGRASAIPDGQQGNEHSTAHEAHDDGGEAAQQQPAQQPSREEDRPNKVTTMKDLHDRK